MKRKAAKIVPELELETETEEEEAPSDGSMKGLGAKSMALLAEAGFKTRDDVEKVGPPEAFRRVRALHPNVNNQLLWQLTGALLDLDWKELPQDMKQHLLFEVEAFEQKALKAAAKDKVG